MNMAKKIGVAGELLHAPLCGTSSVWCSGRRFGIVNALSAVSIVCNAMPASSAVPDEPLLCRRVQPAGNRHREQGDSRLYCYT